MKTVSIFGSTGSVGQSTIDVLQSQPGQFRVKTLTAHSNVARLAEQARLLNAEHAVIADPALYDELKGFLAGTSIEPHAGQNALCDLAAQPVDVLMAAIVGMAGLEPLIASLGHARAVAIANKEPLVSAGPLVLSLARERGTAILPVDSEHNAIFQVFEPENRAHILRLILTASGGPFRTWTAEAIAAATPAQAVAHPNWSMGRKISVDSASLMNKALEMIEAHVLFDMPESRIDVLVHPQSIIHSMVEYADGSMLAQLGAPDMRTPIAYALAWPDRMATPGQRLDLLQLTRLDFEQPDTVRFPALNLARACINEGPAARIALNAANEIAVEAFLAGRIDFSGIMDVVETALTQRPGGNPATLQEILDYDALVRRLCETYISRERDQPKAARL